MGHKNFKAAAILASPVFLNKEKTIEKVMDLAGQATAQGAKLVVFPETFIPNYPWWVWMSINNPKRLELYRRLYENSIEVPGPEIDDLAQTAARLATYMVIGVNECEGGTLYNTQVFIDDHGHFLGKRRKLMPTGEEKTVWGWGYGNDLKVFDTKLGRIGGLICYEHSMALARFALYSMGEEIHIANWPGANFKSQPRDRSRIIDAAVRHTAFEGQVFVVFSSSCLSPEEVQFYIELDPLNKDILSAGGGISGIVDPLGNYVAGPIEHDEGIAIGEMNITLINDAKHMVDSVGHYARNDIFRLLINRDTQYPTGTKANSGFLPPRARLLDHWDKIRDSIGSLDEPALKNEATEFEIHLRDFLASST
jgi:nitrilase